MLGKTISQMSEAEIRDWEAELLRRGKNPVKVEYPKGESITNALSDVTPTQPSFTVHELSGLRAVGKRVRRAATETVVTSPTKTG